MTLKQKEVLYLKWKLNYYLGNELVSDATYDKLEDELRQEGSQFVGIVDSPVKAEIKKLNYFTVQEIVEIFGASDDNRKERFDHLSPMLSLQKIQIQDEDDKPYHDLELFFDRMTCDEFEAGPKMDGNSIELIYIDGVLHQGLTRGDKTAGLDKTDKVKLIVPNTIEVKGIVEVRGELIIEQKLWESKYSDPTKTDNSRNWTAGTLNRDDFDPEVIKDITFVAYSLVSYVGKKKTYVPDAMVRLKEMGFNSTYEPLIIKFNGIKEFDDMYNRFKYYREYESPFLLDGIVIKFPENRRTKLGESTSQPKWAVAIKFPAKQTTTVVKDIIWKQGKLGDFTPLAILEPIELDGVVITKCSLHNLGFVLSKKCYPGAIVEIARFGDIIPGVKSVVSGSPDFEEYEEYYNNFLSSK